MSKDSENQERQAVAAEFRKAFSAKRIEIDQNVSPEVARLRAEAALGMAEDVLGTTAGQGQSRQVVGLERAAYFGAIAAGYRAVAAPPEEKEVMQAKAASANLSAMRATTTTARSELEGGQQQLADLKAAKASSDQIEARNAAIGLLKGEISGLSKAEGTAAKKARTAEKAAHGVIDKMKKFFKPRSASETATPPSTPRGVKGPGRPGGLGRAGG